MTPASCGSTSPVDIAIARDRNRSFTRNRCVQVLRRYFNVCAEVGRVPSVLGREIEASPARTSSRRPSTFEDGVIFSIDVERCLEELDAFERGLIVRLVLQEHSEEDAARLLHCCRETVSRRLPNALDKIARVLRQRGLLFRWRRRRMVKPPAESTGVSINAGAEPVWARTPQPGVIRRRAARFEPLTVPVEIVCQDLAGGEINVCV